MLCSINYNTKSNLPISHTYCFKKILMHICFIISSLCVKKIFKLITNFRPFLDLIFKKYKYPYLVPLFIVSVLKFLFK